MANSVNFKSSRINRVVFWTNSVVFRDNLANSFIFGAIHSYMRPIQMYSKQIHFKSN